MAQKSTLYSQPVTRKTIMIRKSKVYKGILYDLLPAEYNDAVKLIVERTILGAELRHVNSENEKYELEWNPSLKKKCIVIRSKQTGNNLIMYGLNDIAHFIRMIAHFVKSSKRPNGLAFLDKFHTDDLTTSKFRKKR